MSNFLERRDLSPKTIFDTQIPYQTVVAFYKAIGWRNDQFPQTVDLPQVIKLSGLRELYSKSQCEYDIRKKRGGLHGLMEWNGSLNYIKDMPLNLVDIRKGTIGMAFTTLPREEDIVLGSQHTHPLDVPQSAQDVNHHFRSNRLIEGVVTCAGRLFYLIKSPEAAYKPIDNYQVACDLISVNRLVLKRYGLRNMLGIVFDVLVPEEVRLFYLAELCKRRNYAMYLGNMDNLKLERFDS